MTNHPIRLGISLLALAVLLACNKRQTAPVGTNPYANDSSAIDVMTSLYSEMAQAGINANLSVLAGLSADELALYPTGGTAQFTAYYQNNLGATTAGFEFWDIFYNYVSIADSVIAGAGNSTTLSTTVKTQLVGQAYFIRALSYFYLVILYGDCPLVLTTNSNATKGLSRTPAAQVWQQIIDDADSAAAALPASFSSETPTRWAAMALLSRAYLYTEDYAHALNTSNQIINSGSFSLVADLDSCFLVNSTEAIWQLPLPNVYPYISATEAINFIPPDANTVTPDNVDVTTTLLKAFEPNDLRRIHWVDSISMGSFVYYFPYKYKIPIGVAGSPTSEAETVFRLSEQYLIRAEAEAQLSQLPAAIDDLNVVRTRAGLPSESNVLSQHAVLDAIAHERQVELFTEWGQRWLDLKRTGTINTVMPSVAFDKGGTWNPDWVLWPLPATSLTADAALTQNSGY
jgi:hypothetical protein